MPWVLQTSHAQLTGNAINWDTDTVSILDAKKSQARYRADLVNARKKATTRVTMDVAKLNELFTILSAKGVQDVQFLMVTIRKEDTARYAKRNPGLSNSDRNDLIGRQQVLIRVPRAAFEPAQGLGKNSRGGALMTALLLMGWSPLEGGIAGSTSDDDLFLEFGAICPPPGSCD